ncbi:MAG TPA: HXXEE domain-containing protein [Jiangellales bacterium]|nr:HXXEE domain-containing protein [Jiangellales bacterium]
MSVGLVALVGLMLFMIHEFEEIVFIRPWLATTEGRTDAHDMWSRRRGAYPSTEAIALMIAEEFVLVGLILGVAMAADWPELVISAFIVHSLHLVVHLVDAARARRWTPGSVTAFATLPVIAAVSWLFLGSSPINPGWVGAGTVIVAAIVLPNLLMLHHWAPRLDMIILRGYRSRLPEPAANDLNPRHSSPM